MIKNYVLQRCNAPGTNSNVLLGPAPQDRMTWAQAYSDGSPVFYFLDDGLKAEWGVGTFRAGNPATVSRDTVVGNTAGNATILNFTSAVDCYNEIPGDRMPYINGNVILAPNARLDTHAGGVPIGASMDFWGTAAPAGWVFANGQSLSRTSYALLFAVLGTTYGAPDANTFRVPNLQESVSVGRSTMGSAASPNRMPSIANISVLGAAIGHQDLPAHTHTLNWSDPGHAHALADGGHAHSISDPGHLHSYRRQPFGAGNTLALGSGVALGEEGHFTDDGVRAPTFITIAAALSGTSIFASFTGIVASVASSGAGNQANIPPAVVCNIILYAGPIP